MADQKLTGVKGVSTPKLNALNKDPVSRSILSLLTPEANKPRTTGDGKAQTIPKSTLDRISQITSTTVDANRELMEAVPGAHKALSILQAAILSPRNLTTINLSYTSATYEGRNNDLNTMLLNKVKDYVENNYKITDRLQDLVADILFYKGGRPIALLSSSSLDNIINGHVRASMEALSDEYRDGKFVTRGYLGDNDTVRAKGRPTASLESLIAGDIPTMTSDIVGTEDIGITVTDNDSVLRLPHLKLALARNAMAKKVRVPTGLRATPRQHYGIEALDEKGQPKQKGDNRGNSSVAKALSEEQYANVYNQLFKQRDYKQTDLVEVRRDDELTMQNVDNALWLDLPFESFIPVHMPGNPRARIGGYVLLDPDGNPLSTAIAENNYQDPLQNKMDTSNAIDGTKGIIEMAREFREGRTDQFSLVEFRKKINEEIERDLVQRIVNGTFGQKVALGMTDEIKQMMLARTLRNLKTKVLFIPEESLVYFAFDFNRFGVGRSLLERSRLYASMAMANVISSTLANIASSTNITTLGITLDPDNPEPDATVEAIVTTHMNGNRSMSSLIGARNPRDVINIMDEASIQIKTSGHPGYPDIDVDVTNDKRNITPPDPEWNDRLLEMLWSMWGVPPELLSSQNATTFAIEHINNNALFRKSTGMQRQMLCATLSELVQKLVFKSGSMMNDLYQTIIDNKKLWSPSSKRGKEQLKELKEEHPEIDNNDQSLANFILVNFINSIELSLPEPLEGDVEDQNRMYDTYRDRYEKGIKDIYTDEVLSYILEDVGGDTSKFEVWRQNLISHKMREWMAGSGSYNDLTELCEVGDDSNASITLLAGLAAFNEQSIEALIEYLKQNNKVKERIKKSLEKLEEGGHTENNPAQPGFGDPNDPNGENGDPGAGGGDMFGAEGGEGGGADGFGGEETATGGEGDGFSEGGAETGDASTEGADNVDAAASAEGGEADASLMSTEATSDNPDDLVNPEDVTENPDDVTAGLDNPELVDPEADPNATPEEEPTENEPGVEAPIEGEENTDESEEGAAKAGEVKPEEFSEETLDDNSDAEFNEETLDDHSNEEFEEEQHDDGTMKFGEPNEDPSGLEFADAAGKPSGRQRKSKRRQKKEDKANKSAEKADKDAKPKSDDGLDFNV